MITATCMPAPPPPPPPPPPEAQIALSLPASAAAVLYAVLNVPSVCEGLRDARVTGLLTDAVEGDLSVSIRQALSRVGIHSNMENFAEVRDSLHGAFRRNFAAAADRG